MSFKWVIAVLLPLAITIGCASSQQVAMLKSGVANWNKWRKENPRVKPDLEGLVGARLDSSFHPGAAYFGINLHGIDFRGADLKGADLGVANLDSADLDSATLDNADLGIAFLKGARLRGALVQKANLQGADLQKADLTGANLTGAILRGANLDSADLRRANLAGAFLFEANFSLANLEGAGFQGADLGKVASFFKAKLDPGILSEIKTKWPKNLATIWDETKEDWVVDDTLLEQIKKTGWHGWSGEEDKGKKLP